MSTKETIVDLATYNLWRRGDETIEMPSPAKIGATIDRAVSLLRKYHDLERELVELISVNATGAARLAHAMAQLATEREKVLALRLACERIVEQWDKNHDAAPFHAGNVMYSRASAALAATEDAQ
jgi:hypothetical protein